MANATPTSAIVGLGTAKFRGKDEFYVATTVDSLPGSSGGPVVDEKGVLIGVAAKGVATEENKFRYDVDPERAARLADVSRAVHGGAAAHGQERAARA